MFTGIVEELGEVVAVQDLGQASRLHVRGPLVTSDAAVGDSIAVNGVCLTVVTSENGAFTADVMAETLRRSSLGALSAGSKVNLERSVRITDRLGGHVVLGHVDGTGQLLEVRPAEHWTVVTVSLPGDLGRYVVEKGSITVDGVSLTVSAVGPDRFEISLIPTTLGRTTLGSKGLGDPVNLEVDILAKHVEKLLQANKESA
ncbi:MAG: riboflavin synthase [Actinomycetota bacterium]|nr:riboflavin synthase [Actinomycetota bacterium]